MHICVKALRDSSWRAFLHSKEVITMRKNELHTEYHDFYEYFGNTEFERIRKQGDRTIRHDWLIFDSDNEAIDYYAKKSGVKLSCHHLRHTMATQMLNADTDLVTIQTLLDHSRITTTEWYSRVHSAKAR